VTDTTDFVSRPERIVFHVGGWFRPGDLRQGQARPHHPTDDAACAAGVVAAFVSEWRAGAIAGACASAYPHAAIIGEYAKLL
jgi:hypothetical protein